MPRKVFRNIAVGIGTKKQFENLLREYAKNWGEGNETQEDFQLVILGLYQQLRNCKPDQNPSDFLAALLSLHDKSQEESA